MERIPKNARGQGNQRRELEKVRFMRHFQGPDIWADEKLWRTYQDWRRMRQTKDFEAFGEEYAKARAEILKQMAEWPNPFKNGNKGEPYTLTFHLPDFIQQYRFHGLEDLNLAHTRDKLDKNRCHITGVPDKSGEFEIMCHFICSRIFPEITVKDQIFIQKFKIRINPDPRELWKNIPSPAGLEYAKPDEESYVMTCGQWQLLGASQRGRSHAHGGLPRDDDFGLGCFNGWSILMVADGAGSAPFSREGSALASETALNVCRRQLADAQELESVLGSIRPGVEGWQSLARKLAYSILAQAAFEAHKAIRLEAQAKGREPKAYATTFLLALAKKFPAGWVVMSFQIGDGAMALVGGDSFSPRPLLLADPDEGEYGGQTRFITMKDVFEPRALMERIHIHLVDRLEGIVLMTDGVSDARFATLANLRNPALWRQLWLELTRIGRSRNPEGAMLEWLKFWSKGNHDDRTVAMMLREEVLSLGEAPRIIQTLARK